jgi:hypothetical protein
MTGTSPVMTAFQREIPSAFRGFSTACEEENFASGLTTNSRPTIGGGRRRRNQWLNHDDAGVRSRVRTAQSVARRSRRGPPLLAADVSGTWSSSRFRMEGPNQNGTMILIFQKL